MVTVDPIMETCIYGGP